jgi:hypothetical protein
VTDYARTAFVDAHWIRGLSVKGFWWQPPPGTPLAADPFIAWPFWHDDDDRQDDGLTDWSVKPSYCNGSFWDGLKKAFNGVYQPCGVLVPAGTGQPQALYQRMTCCQSPRTPWRYLLTFADMYVTYADGSTGHESGSVRMVSDGICGWEEEPGEPLVASWAYTLTPFTGCILHVEKDDADGNLVWFTDLVFSLAPHTDSYDAMTLGPEDADPPVAASLLFTPTELSAGCDGGSDYFLDEFGTPLISEGGDFYVTEG